MCAWNNYQVQQFVFLCISLLLEGFAEEAAAVVVAVVVNVEVLAAAGWWSLMTGCAGTPLLLPGGDARFCVLPLN